MKAIPIDVGMAFVVSIDDAIVLFSSCICQVVYVFAFVETQNIASLRPAERPKPIPDIYGV